MPNAFRQSSRYIVALFAIVMQDMQEYRESCACDTLSEEEALGNLQSGIQSKPIK